MCFLLLVLFLISISANIRGASKQEKPRLFIGGSVVASISQAPYVVALVANNSDTGKEEPFCTGSIVHEDWVITAAQCIVEGDKSYIIVAGCETVNELRNTTIRQARNKLEEHIHPSYRPLIDRSTVGVFDIALVKVDDKFVVGPKVGTIQFWAQEWNGVKADGEEYLQEDCDAYGWGEEKPDVFPEVLRQGYFIVQHGSSACFLLSSDQNRRLLCTKELTRESACPGDSGGPLVCRGLLAGVAHSIYKVRYNPPPNESPLAKCGEVGIVSAWMYVCPMVNWIHDVVPDVPAYQLSCRSSSLHLPGLTFRVLIILLPLFSYLNI